MARRILLATPMLALATIWSPAFAYSHLPPKAAARNSIHAQQSQQSFAAVGQATPSWTIEQDNHRYHGGPKAND